MSFWRRKSDQLFYRYVLAVEANERQDVQQALWDEFVTQLIVEDGHGKGNAELRNDEAARPESQAGGEL